MNFKPTSDLCVQHAANVVDQAIFFPNEWTSGPSDIGPTISKTKEDVYKRTATNNFAGNDSLSKSAALTKCLREIVETFLLGITIIAIVKKSWRSYHSQFYQLTKLLHTNKKKETSLLF